MQKLLKPSKLALAGGLVLAAAVAAVAGASIAGLINNDAVFERHVVTQPFPGMMDLVETSDAVVLGTYTGFTEDVLEIVYDEDDEGYIEGEPSDLFSNLHFRVSEVIKGDLDQGQVVDVQWMTALLDGDDKIRVVDKRLAEFQRSDGTLKDGDGASKNDGIFADDHAGKGVYILFLVDNDRTVDDPDDYRSRGWGIASLTPDRTIKFPDGTVEAAGRGLTLDELQATRSN